MEESKDFNCDTPESQEENKISETEETIPQISDKGIKIPIKFNKEERELSLEEATTLAQKGLKYDMITPEFERLRALALKNGKSVGEFLSMVESGLKKERRDEILSKCGGDEELTDNFISMEEKLAENDGQFEELKEFFPEISGYDELPEEVTARSREKGSRIVDEYLRYLHSLKMQKKASEEKEKAVKKHTLGSLKTEDTGAVDPVRNMFLKGLWG